MDSIEYKKTYQEYKAELDAELSRTAEGFVRIGYLLKVARDTDILQESGYTSVTEFAKAEYNIDKTQVSRFIHINDKFSEGGYSDTLEEHYRGFGYAKLTLMLQLPDEINEELTPDFSKSEIQVIKDEVDAEAKITDIEVALEGETEATAVMETVLGKTVKQLGEDEPQLYADIWTGIRQQEWSIEKLQAILAPAGEKIYSVRIRGVGRKEMMVKDKDNGNGITLVDLRGAGKMWYSWEDMLQVWESITAGEPETGYKGAWETIYFSKWPLKEKVAPVQPDKRKQSKVTKSKPTKEPMAAVVQPEPQEPEEEQLPGQMNVADYPGVLPANYEEIKEETEDAADATSESEGEGESDPVDHGTAGESERESEGESLSDTESSNEDVDDVSSGLGVAGDVGESEEVHDQETVSTASGVMQELSLWRNIEKAKENVVDYIDNLLAWAPEETNQKDYTELEDIQKAYDAAVNLAAAIEQVLIAKQREAAKQDG